MEKARGGFNACCLRPREQLKLLSERRHPPRDLGVLMSSHTLDGTQIYHFELRSIGPNSEGKPLAEAVNSTP